MTQDNMNTDFVPSGEPPKKGMSRNTKILIGVVGGLLGLCCIIGIVAFVFLRQVGSQFEQGFDDPEAAAETAQGIVAYSLPAGFSEQGAMSFLGIEMAFITNASNDSVIMLMSFPQALAGNEEQMRQQMEDSMAENFGDQNINFTPVESREVTINGQPAVVSILEGTNENGAIIRQATSIFEGDGGKPSMLMIVSPASQWDASNLDGFIDSLN